MRSQLKNRLAAGAHLLGTMVTTFHTVDLPKILQVCGYDFIIIDCEHGSFTTREAADMIAVARAIGLPALVRIPILSREHALKFAEMGANGLLLPNTESADQARQLVDYVKYAPLGHRGVSLSRPHTDFQKVNGPDYMAASNDDTILICQIESRAGVGHIEEIMAVDGIDAALIGPNDMSQDYGLLGQFTHPEITDAFWRVIRAAKEQHKYSGVHFGSAAALKPWLHSGMTFNMCNSDLGLLLNGAKELAALREEIQP